VIVLALSDEDPQALSASVADARRAPMMMGLRRLID
jgi:hypothetical protein